MHFYMLKYEETIFRKDYFVYYLKILVTMNQFLRVVNALKTEIEFIKNNEKCRGENLNVYILDLLLMYFITHDEKAIEDCKYLSLAKKLGGVRKKQGK